MALGTRGCIRTRQGKRHTCGARKSRGPQPSDGGGAVSCPPCCHHRALIVNGLIYAGFTATWQGRFRAAVSACHDAVQVAEAAHDAEHLAAAPFCLALALAGCGEYEAALAGLHDLLAFARYCQVGAELR